MGSCETRAELATKPSVWRIRPWTARSIAVVRAKTFAASRGILDSSSTNVTFAMWSACTGRGMPDANKGRVECFVQATARKQCLNVEHLGCISRSVKMPAGMTKGLCESCMLTLVECEALHRGAG